MTVRIIHVGLGGWGGSWAREAIPAVSEVQVVGIVDPSADTLQAVRTDLGLPESAAFPSLTAALAAVDADAVVVTAPAVTHVPLALEALDAGKHVLVEKPFANTADEAAAAVHRAEERGLVLQVSQNYRFYPAPQVVRDLLRTDAVGELSAINVDFRQWDNDRPFADHPHYRFPHAMFNDMAIHHVDLLRMVTGQEAVRVFAKATYPSFSKYQDEAVASMLIEMQDGLVVSYRGSWLSRAEHTAWAGEWSIQGEDGELQFTSRAGEPGDVSGDVVTVRRPGDTTATSVELPTAEHHDRQGQLQAFARSIEGGPAPETSGRDNLRSLALMEAATRSAASGLPEDVVVPS
ncbi:Gfo/Idh/MocA family oxidoreductase [Curtobacterium sp. MCLR17_007]|uniref:Gfo/Idh/MocA family protein n=1 Tax=unclassified Curtobacterium TaxID=257496 RepID=UPI0006F6396A|nr:MULTISPECIES: Gfo/Idh/MocA family oxidoreductase [unclassified Curtobacterium]KQS09256.1 oxidoreductase [Curtobacterium sp. Leaf183]WIB60663.1 Gfo/Idh/MocA family oxidoreductase [Curtobacterium sp. MCLR17_007]